MRTTITAFLLPNGEVSGMYSDHLRLQGLTHVRALQRESHVEFNTESQQWEARDTVGKLLVESVSRDECIREEMRILTSKLERELTTQGKLV